MECKMSLVHALDMVALSVRCSALSMVYNGDTLHSLYHVSISSEPQGVQTPGASQSKGENSSGCTSQQVHVRSAHCSDVSHLLRAS